MTMASMSIEKAKRIEQLRTGTPMHSWRRIAEVIAEEYPDDDAYLHGNQLYGQHLCLQALMLLHDLKEITELEQIPESVRNAWAL